MQPMVGLPMRRAAGGASGPRSTPGSEDRLGQRTRRVDRHTADGASERAAEVPAIAGVERLDRRRASTAASAVFHSVQHLRKPMDLSSWPCPSKWCKSISARQDAEGEARRA